MMITPLKAGAELFWIWFSKNSDRFLYFEDDQQNLFHELKAELEKIERNLVFEFSSILKDGTREFIISADGLKSSFPTVIEVVDQAPDLKDWKVIAFRQPRKEITQISYQNLNVNLNDVFSRHTKNHGKIDVELFIKGFYESPEWTSISFVLLDTILGEYDAEMYLGWIDKKPLNSDLKVDNLMPIKDLHRVFQAYKLEFYN